VPRNLGRFGSPARARAAGVSRRGAEGRHVDVSQASATGGAC